MLKNPNILRVTADYIAGNCTVLMENGDVFYETDITDKGRLFEYLKMLQEEDGLIVSEKTLVEEISQKTSVGRSTEETSADRSSGTAMVDSSSGKIAAAGKNEPKLQVRCFGNFEVFYQDKLVYFERKSAKEVFAYLIDKRGASAGRVEICSAIWEDDEMVERRRAYFRTLVVSLRKALEAVGMQDAFIRERDTFAVNPKLIDCDYYRYLEGDESPDVKFRGEYMSQYSWAENTLGILMSETNFVFA